MSDSDKTEGKKNIGKLLQASLLDQDSQELSTGSAIFHNHQTGVFYPSQSIPVKTQENIAKASVLLALTKAQGGKLLIQIHKVESCQLVHNPQERAHFHFQAD